ncbi:hypothetical protein BaRGS_00002391 [Batillaria attramentaria]|uniref:Uncharacterized protein n=1 Tax=Batillaria attramentaria TaxID=370345 RepID=A0ABD0M390_9CAEN
MREILGYLVCGSKAEPGFRGSGTRVKWMARDRFFECNANHASHEERGLLSTRPERRRCSGWPALGTGGIWVFFRWDSGIFVTNACLKTSGLCG